MTSVIPSLKPSDVLRMDALMSLALINEKLSRLPDLSAASAARAEKEEGKRVVNMGGGKQEIHYRGAVRWMRCGGS